MNLFSSMLLQQAEKECPTGINSDKLLDKVALSDVLQWKDMVFWL